MMAKRIEKPVYAFIRSGNSLVPEMEYDINALEGIPQGHRVKIEIREWRNHSRLRAYWAMLHDVIEAAGANDLSAERLHQVIKLKNGCVDLISLPDGTVVSIPGSINFEKMDETEFVGFFRKAETWLAETYGYEPNDKA